MHHVDARVGGRQLVEHRAGAVRRVVVDEQEIGVGQRGEQARRRSRGRCRARCRSARRSGRDGHRAALYTALCLARCGPGARGSTCCRSRRCSCPPAASPTSARCRTATSAARSTAQNERQRQAALVVGGRVRRRDRRGARRAPMPASAHDARALRVLDRRGRPAPDPAPGGPVDAQGRVDRPRRLHELRGRVRPRCGSAAAASFASTPPSAPRRATTACTAQLAAASREYRDLAKSDDTGPDALLGLARVQLRTGDARAEATLAELDKRFATRDLGELPVALVTATLRAQTADAILVVADAVLARRYDLDTAVELGVAARLRSRLSGDLSAAQLSRLAKLDARVAEIRADARAAAGLADDVGEMVRDATRAWRGRPASREPGRTLIYRRRADGGVSGSRSTRRCSRPPRARRRGDVAQHARVLVLASGASPSADLRAHRAGPARRGAAAPVARDRQPGARSGSARRGDPRALAPPRRLHVRARGRARPRPARDDPRRGARPRARAGSRATSCRPCRTSSRPR